MYVETALLVATDTGMMVCDYRGGLCGTRESVQTHLNGRPAEPADL